MHLPIWSMTAAIMVVTPVGTASARDVRFDGFFTAFRTAVLAGDRRAVARMTHFPFTDYRAGRYCEPGVAECTVARDTLTSADEATFLRKYDRLFTPAIVAAIRARRVRGFVAGRDDGDIPGPIDADEYLLEVEGGDTQWVFARKGATWKLQRVAFQS